MTISRHSIAAAAIGAAAFTAGAGPASAGQTRYVEGWPASTGESFHYSSPAVADVDGDGRAEIAVAGWGGKLFLYDARGRVMPGYPVTTSGREGERSSPALADLDGDGKLDVVLSSADGKIYAYDYRGQALGGWPLATPGGETAGVAVQDFTAHHGLETFAAAGKAVYGVHANGSEISGWPVALADTPRGIPAVGDLDGDHSPELVIAAGKEVYAFTTSGASVPGWPAVLDGTVEGPPVLADVDGDGRTEVLVGTSAGTAYVLTSAGRARAGWPQPVGIKPITSSAAVGDLDGDGELTAVFVAGGTYTHGATVAAFDAGGRLRPGFPKQLTQTVAAAPLILDVDGDGAAEIFLATYAGSLLAVERNGSYTVGFPLKLFGQGITSTPAAADVDNDGLLDIVVASHNGYLEVVSTGTTYEPANNYWPTLGGNCWRTGKYLVAGVGSQTLNLSARPGEVVVRWRADARDDRAGWGVLKGVKDAASGHVDYVEIAAVDEQPSLSYSYVDPAVEEGIVYYYKIEERLDSGAVNTYGPKSVRALGGAKAVSALARCYPNPFTTQVNISYVVAPSDGPATATTIAIYDISGKLIRNLVSEVKSAGEYIAEWDGTDAAGAPVASGVYLACLRAGKNAPVSTKSVVLIR